MSFLDDTALRDDLALSMQFVVLKLAFQNFAILPSDPAEASQFAIEEVTFDDVAIGLGDLAWAMHYVLAKHSLTNGAIWPHDLGHAMQVVILKLADSAVTLVNVPTEPIDAVKAICPHLELALVEELLLSFTIMIDDANATNLALILEVPAVFYLDELLDPTNPEFSLQLKRIVHHQLLEVNTMLCQIFVK